MNIMKNFLLIVLIFSFTTSVAQRGYVERAIRKNYEEKHGEPGAKKGNDWINNHLMNVDIEDSYSFPTHVKMHTASYKNGKVREENDIDYYFNTSGTIVGLKSVDESKKKREEQFIIYDYVKNAMIMLNEKEMTGMAMNLNAFRSGESIERRNAEIKSGKTKETNTSCKATGKTKNILGYACAEYTCYDLDTDTRSEVWVASKVAFNTKNMDAKNAFAPYYANGGYGGMVLQGKFYKEDQLTSTLDVTELNTKANFIKKTTEYDFGR